MIEGLIVLTILICDTILIWYLLTRLKSVSWYKDWPYGDRESTYFLTEKSREKYLKGLHKGHVFIWTGLSSSEIDLPQDE